LAGRAAGLGWLGHLGFRLLVWALLGPFADFFGTIERQLS